MKDEKTEVLYSYDLEEDGYLRFDRVKKSETKPIIWNALIKCRNTYSSHEEMITALKMRLMEIDERIDAEIKRHLNESIHN